MAIPVVSVTDVVVTESAGFAEFVFRLDAPASEPVSLRYQSKDGSAKSAAAGVSDPDFIAVGRYGYETLTFAAGETVKTVRVALVDDTMPEPDESFQLQVLLPEGLKIGTSLATATILDDQSNLIGLPVVSVEDTVVDEKAGRAYFTITLDRPGTSAVSLTYRTAQGTAVVGTDYEGLTARTMTFAAGERAKTVAINLIDDGAREDGEYFDLLLSEVSGALMPDTRGRAFIGPSDQAVSATPVVSVADVVTDESAGFAEFVFRLDAPASEPVSLRYQSKDGSARSAAAGIADPDFIAVGRYGYETLTFAPGETVKTARVGLVDDAAAEPAESFQLQLLLPQGLKIGTSLATATILDDRSTLTGAPVAAIEDTVVDEQGGRAYFTVTLDRPSSSPVSVTYQTADGTAAAGVDYQPLAPQTLVFAPGERVSTVAVNLLDDATREDGEYFDLLLSEVSGALMPDTRGRAFIGPSDQTTSATPVVSVADIVADESKGYAEFVFRLDAPSSEPVSLRYQSKDGSARSAAAGIADPDFIAVGRYGYETLTFAPGETVKTARVGLVDDAAPEPAESFQLQLLLPQGLKIGTSLATATISESERQPTNPDVFPAVPAARFGRTADELPVELARLANLAYADQAQNMSGSDLPRGGWAPVRDIRITNASFSDGVYHSLDNRAWAHLYVGEVGGARTLVVAFRGTDKLGQDFWDYGVAEPGDFVDHWARFGPLINAIPEYLSRYGVQQVYVTGHSLGGAMTQIFMDQGQFQDTSSRRYVGATFGSPGANSPRSDSRLLHVEHTDDPIPDARNILGTELSGIRLVIDRTDIDITGFWGYHKSSLYVSSMQLLADAGVSLHPTRSLRLTLHEGTSNDDRDVQSGGRQSVLYGMGGNDTITGSDATDFLVGDDFGAAVGNDVLYGRNGNDHLYGGPRNDYIDGGGDSDMAYFFEARSNYDFVTYGGVTFVARLGGGGDGLDRLANIEWLDFAGQKVAVSATNTSLEYVASYPDLMGAFGADPGAGFNHFSTAGYLEGRTISFSGLEYIASYPDLTKAFGVDAETGASHFIQAGRFEGRTTTFDGLEYVASYGDLIKAFGANGNAGAAHYIQAGRFEGRSATFNGLEYIASHADLINTFHDQIAAHPNPDLGTLHYARL